MPVNDFNTPKLRDLLVEHFDITELNSLMFSIGLRRDEIAGATIRERVEASIGVCQRQGMLSQLLAAAEAERSHVDWAAARAASPPAGPPRDAQPSPRPANPFGRTGRLNGPPDYLVRQSFTAEIVHELRKGVNLSIVGETQTGKSSLLWYLAQHGPQLLGRDPADFVYLDMQLLGDDHDFFDALCDELGVPPARGYRLSRALRGRNVLLCLDEVEKMTWDGFTHELRSQLRGLADGPGAPLKLVIASRTPLARLFPDAPGLTSPLAGICHQFALPPFTLAETEALVDVYLRATGYAFPHDTIEAAWQASGGYAARLQRELKVAFDREHLANP